MIDVAVVGSGASAVHAAYPLVEAGLRVAMVDVGDEDRRYGNLIPARGFEQIRRSDTSQHRYFLGDDFEGIPLGPVRVGAQLTPPRQHLAAALGKLPIDSPEFHAMQSLALGGLAAGWGAATPPYTDEDLAGWPITRHDLQPHYDAVARRVGICGTDEDDLDSYYGASPFLLPPARIDSNAVRIRSAYARRREWFNDRGLHLGHPRLAMATRRFRGRGPTRYLDMEFWSDADGGVYRPRYTLEELRRHSNFEYLSPMQVDSFARLTNGGVRVLGRDLAAQVGIDFECRRLVLAAGAIGTARIVLRSLGAVGAPVPLLSNPYTYYPCLVIKSLFGPTRDRRHSLTQVMMYHRPADEKAALLQAQVYSYRSLLTFKLVKESPLPVRESIRVMRLLQSAFVIVGVHHRDDPAEWKSLKLQDAETGRLSVHYSPTDDETALRMSRERELMRLFPRLGCIPLKRIDPGEGSSIHYAGTLPMSENSAPLTTRPDGSLRGADDVFVVDGSVFPTLPAKGLTYTCMANANRVGEGIAEWFERRGAI